MHQLAPAERLLRPSAFCFAVDQIVRLGDMLGVVTACDYTFAGREMYTVTFDCAERPVRTVLGAYLAPDHATEARPRGAVVRSAARALRIRPQIRQAELLAA